MKQKLKITTLKMKGENEKQYWAWLLYSEMGSMAKMMRAWEQIREGFGKSSMELKEKIKKLGVLPCQRAVEKWSSKYRWVERADTKLAEDIEGIRKETKKIEKEKKHKIALVFDKASNKVLARLKEIGEEPTIKEMKLAWEMFQVELGKPTTRAAIDKEQEPPTPEEEEEGTEIDNIIKKAYVSKNKRKNKPSLLGSKKQNKKRKKSTD